jgi:hypothetical protein
MISPKFLSVSDDPLCFRLIQWNPALRRSGVEKTSRLRSRDPVASGVECGPHGGKNSKMKSVDGFLVDPQNQGQAGTSWEPSHEW